LPDQDRLKRISGLLAKATPAQLEFVDRILGELQRPATFIRLPQSDIVNDSVLQRFGDTLRIHHCFSAEPFTKDRFEFALEDACNSSGLKATRANRNNPGHDMTIGGQAFSLKTQANKGIRSDKLHISKFMELGKGQWSDKEADLVGLREQFFHHMRSYDRIITLRRLSSATSEVYELVEIPKALLSEAAKGKLRMMTDSPQMPRPGYCTVADKDGAVKFELYFDGGTERKLQIRNINKRLCIVHATWTFPIEQRVAL
jgi:type II restriction enzyme